MGKVGNAVLPHYLEVSEEEVAGAGGSLQDTTLRLGEVVAAYPPNDPRNRGISHNREWVYVVNVTYRDGAGIRSIVPYRCTVADSFGGMADHFRHFARRTDTEGNASFTKGNQVLVLCPNGDKSNALIIGGVRHSKDDSSDPNDAFLDFVFNGVHATIDKDGALSLTVPGATKLDGTPADDRDSNNHGSSVTLAKDGTISVADNNGQSIVVSPANKTITILAGDAVSQIKNKWLLKVPTVEIDASVVNVKALKINLGDEEIAIDPLDEVVVGSGIDTFTGLPFKALGDTSLIVKAKKE
ncbi:MAG: hypothetical protein EPO08_20975 [Rhodospirillaceae bacterium]|nr:MAG: hypothetical protein EPO08_20975 [Rhodospirillaceae bacterium]